MERSKSREWLEELGALAIGVIVFLFLYPLLTRGCSRRPPPPGGPLVVYCAHDAVFAEQVLARFELETGISVQVRYDTEATKSLSLVQKIAAERERPRCDLFWNNEQLGTMWLAEQGLLKSYKGEGFARIPDRFKDAEGRWVGFAARMRVWIVNTGKAEPMRPALDALIATGDLSRLAIAKPLYGTTRTHYTVLWDAWGPERVKAWHTDWRSRGVIEVNGNAMVKSLVAEGTCDFGLTDTDDYFTAKDDGKPVTMWPYEVGTRNAEHGADSDSSSVPLPRSEFRVPSSQFIVIPNTVAIIQGTRHAKEARRLADYLLSAETEMALAASASRQIPLGPVDGSRLSEEVRQLVGWSKNAYPLNGLGGAGDECLEWLRSEYLKE